MSFPTMIYRGAYDDTVTYQPGDVVRWTIGGTVDLGFCIATVTGISPPADDGTHWMTEN